MLAREVEGLLRIASVAGHEAAAARYIAGRLAGLPVRRDGMGNVLVEFGHGRPRRLLACSLDEPGYVVGAIGADGYLRLKAVGAPRGALWDQFREGQVVEVGTAGGTVPGAVGVRSVHLQRGRSPADAPFDLEDAYVDVGASDAAGVRALGIRLLDPVTLVKRPMMLAGGRLAAPAARAKAACVALAAAARRVSAGGSTGSVVFAWTVLEHAGRRGIERVAREAGPFDQVLLTSEGFGLERRGRALREAAAPPPGAGVLAAGAVGGAASGAHTASHAAPPPAPYTGGPEWGQARVGYLGLPARYADTPVEMVALSDVAALADAFVAAAGAPPTSSARAPALVLPPALGLASSGEEAAATPQGGDRMDAAAVVLGALVARYGVSGDEAPVRQRIRSLLPSWARPRVDARGNLIVTVGSGAPHVAFIAHMDEVGFRVDSVRPDGRLVLGRLGGFYPSLWEAQAALVHTPAGDVAGIVEPRPDWRDATHREPAAPLTLFAGASDAAAAARLGLRAGQTVTMPKRMLRLGPRRAVARGFDDRAGDAALLLALRDLDPAALRRRVTFAWVVEEETGLHGSRALAADTAMADLARVYAVDTFVSSDAPLESTRFADQPLGDGAVVRALDSATLTPRDAIDDVLRLAAEHHIPIQVGTTNGGSDAAPFVPAGATAVPLSWPGRYSHSPAEVADLGDVVALARLVRALAAR